MKMTGVPDLHGRHGIHGIALLIAPKTLRKSGAAAEPTSDIIINVPQSVIVHPDVNLSRRVQDIALRCRAVTATALNRGAASIRIVVSFY
jgi:hypothetical protein